MPKKSINDIRVPTYDDLFTNEEQRQEAKLEKIMEVPVEDIQEFKNHPFRVRNDEQMSELVKSVSENGILVPVLVRPHPNGHGNDFRSQKNECSNGKWSRKDTGYCKRTYG
jgi:ParB family chromosome partitioning protein